jgi:cyclopropane fatty-acyl-phospholipid synthase-like methyltransferase
VHDKYALYERAVQDPAWDVQFLDELITTSLGRAPRDLREDFSGTAQLSREWVSSAPERRAWAVDRDPEPHAWARATALPRLTDDARARLTLVQQDVLDVGPPAVPPVDVIVAMNYSFLIFKARERMRAYFARAREGLRPGGALVLELLGGPRVETEDQERTEHEGFTYVWDRFRVDPITREMTCKIHFAFPDGATYQDAFTYEWRLWTIPELRELLEEAGFTGSEVYWEGPGDDGQGDGVFVPSESARPESVWIAFVVGWR